MSADNPGLLDRLKSVISGNAHDAAGSTAKDAVDTEVERVEHDPADTKQNAPEVSPTDLGARIMDAVEAVLGKDKAEEVGQSIADTARERPDERVSDIIGEQLQTYMGLDVEAARDSIAAEESGTTSAGEPDQAPDELGHYKDLKERYEGDKDKYLFRNTFVVAERLELNIEAYKTGQPGASGKPVSGGDIAMNVFELLQSNIFNSLIEIGLRDYFDKKYPARENDAVTTDEQKVRDIGGPLENEAGFVVDKTGAFRDDGLVATRDFDLKSQDAHNPSTGHYMGVDMTRDPDARSSDMSTTVWRSGRDMMDTAIVDGKAESIRLPDIRLVDFNDTRYLVDSFGKVLTHDGDRASGKEFVDHFPRLDVSAFRSTRPLIESAAVSKGMTVEQYKTSVTSTAQDSFVERNIPRLEAHKEYISKELLPELRDMAADYHAKIESLDTRIVEVTAIRDEVDSKPTEARGVSDQAVIDSCDAKLAQMTDAKLKMETSVVKMDVRIEKLEATVSQYDNASSVVASKQVDIETKFGVVVAADTDAVGKVSDADYGLTNEDIRGIGDVFKDLDADPRDIDPASSDPLDGESGEAPTNDKESPSGVDVEAPPVSEDVVVDAGDENHPEPVSEEELLEQIDAAVDGGIVAPEEDTGDGPTLDSSGRQDVGQEDEKASIHVDGPEQADNDVPGSGASTAMVGEEDGVLAVDASSTFPVLNDSEYKEHIESLFGDTRVEAAIIDGLPLTRDEYIEAIQMIRDSDGGISRDELVRYFEHNEPEGFIETGKDGNTHVLDGPPSVESWAAFEKAEAQSIGKPYYVGVDNDGTTHIDIQTPPDNKFWDIVDKVSPPVDVFPYSSTELADRLQDRVQAFYTGFDRDSTSNPPVYTERMSEFSDHINDVNCNRLPEGVQLPERECVSADDWKELQVERYAAAAAQILGDLGFERDNLNAYIDAHSYRSFDEDQNLQFIYDNVGEEEYDKVLHEYNELSGRIGYLDELEGVCQRIEEITASDISLDDKLYAIEEVGTSVISPEIMEEARLEAFQEDNAQDVSNDQPRAVEAAADPVEGPDAVQDPATNTDGIVEAPAPGEAGAVDEQPGEASVDRYANDLVAQPEADDTEKNALESAAPRQGDSPVEDAQSHHETAVIAEAHGNAGVSDDDRAVVADDDIRAERDMSSSAIDHGAACDRLDAEAATAMEHDAGVDQGDTHHEDAEEANREDKKESGGHEKGVDGEQGSDSVAVAAQAEHDDNTNAVGVTIEDIRDAMDKFFDQDAEGTFSFKEDFMDLHEGELNPLDLYQVLGEKAKEIDEQSDSKSPDEMDNLVDRTASVFDAIENAVIDSFKGQFDQLVDLIDAFKEDGVSGVFEKGLEMELDTKLHSLDGLVNIAEYLNEKLDPEWQADTDSIKESVCEKLEFANLNDSTIEKICDIVESLETIFHGFGAAMADIGSMFTHEDPVDAPTLDVEIGMEAAEGTAVQPDALDVADTADAGVELVNEDISALERQAVDPIGDLAQDLGTGGSELDVGDTAFRDFMTGEAGAGVDAAATADTAVEAAEILI